MSHRSISISENRKRRWHLSTQLSKIGSDQRRSNIIIVLLHSLFLTWNAFKNYILVQWEPEHLSNWEATHKQCNVCSPLYLCCVSLQRSQHLRRVVKNCAIRWKQRALCKPQRQQKVKGQPPKKSVTFCLTAPGSSAVQEDEELGKL